MRRENKNKKNKSRSITYICYHFRKFIFTNYKQEKKIAETRRKNTT